MNLGRRLVMAGLIAAAASRVIWSASAQGADAYRSPYSVKFSCPLSELIGDIQHGKRGQPQRESSLPFAEWYSPPVRRQFAHGGLLRGTFRQRPLSPGIRSSGSASA